MSLERNIGRLLERFPHIHRLAKKTYLRATYLFHRRQGADFPKPTAVFDGFFGYYDKTPWSPDGRSFLFHSPLTGNLLGIELVNLDEGTLVRLDVTRAWSPQQGAMLQWLPKGGGTVIFNTLLDGNLFSKSIRMDGTGERVYPLPVQTVHPAGSAALSLNYRRMHALRPEYGYAVEAENFSPLQPDDNDGVWRFDLDGGEQRLILSINALKDSQPRPEMRDARHKVNHIMYSPSGERFVFMHRWIGENGKFSRLYTASDPDASDLKLLMDDRMVSHYSWRDDNHLIVYGRSKEYGDCYHLVNVINGELSPIGKGLLDRWGDGHPSYSPDKRWIVTDTYPDKGRVRRLLLWDTHKKELHVAGCFFAPWKFDGADRVDLHPRWSPDGWSISIDSVHEGFVRTYIFEVERICKE